MWCPTQARPPLARQNVLLSSAPQASSGRARRRAARGSRARARASGAAPAARAAPSRRCASRSGGRGRGSGRRCPPRRSSASASSKAIGSSETLPLVITSVTPASASSRWCSGVVRQHHAEVGLARRDGGRDRARPAAGGAITIGRSRPVSSAPPPASSTTSARAASRSGDHQRERLVLAVLARAQRGDGRLVVGAAGEVKAADALDRHDRAGAQRRGRGRDRVGRRGAGRGRRRGRAAARAARTPGRRSARRGSGGRAGPRTPPGRPRTSRSRPSSCARGRRARRARS